MSYDMQGQCQYIGAAFVISERVNYLESAIAQQNENGRSEQFENAFVRHIFDKETGKGLICRLHEGEVPAQSFGLNWWSVKGISYDEVMRQAVALLREEQRRAIHVQEMLAGSKGAQAKAARMKEISKQAWAVFDEMVEIEAPDLREYQRMEQGEISEAEYRKEQERMQLQLMEKDSLFSEATEQMKQLNKAFSARNPWVRLYVGLEIPEVLTKEQVRKWIGRLTVDDRMTVEMEIPAEYARWKEQLPAEWMEG